MPPGATYVLARVADALGSATAAFAVPITVAALVPPLPVPAAESMAQLAAQDEVERALAQCDGVEGFLALRVALEPRGMLPSLLGCALRLANRSDTGAAQLAQLLANATYLLNATAGPAVADESVELAVQLAALAMRRVPTEPLLPPLLAQIGRAQAARTVPGGGPEERFAASGLLLASQSALGVPLQHGAITLLPTEPEVLGRGCAAVDSLYILADSWNPVGATASTFMCGPLAQVQLSQDQSGFGQLAALDAVSSCAGEGYCASLVAGAWTRDGCRRLDNASCMCDLSAYPVSLFADIPPVFVGGQPSGPSGFYLGPMGVAALIAVAVVAAAGLLLLLAAALRSSAVLASAPPTTRFAWRAEGAAAAREADLRPPFARQQVSFGDAPYAPRGDLEDFE